MPPSATQPSRPLTPATFHILVTLAEGVAHGYQIKRVGEERTEGAVKLGAGTLYAGIKRMTQDGMIQETEPPQDHPDGEPGARWRFYAITPKGEETLKAEIRRLESDLSAARAATARTA